MDRRASLLLLVVVLILTMPVAAWWNVYLLSIMWGWFISLQFGVPVPSLWMLFGIVLTWRMAFASRSIDADKNKSVGDHISETVLRVYLFPPFVVGIGWVVHTYAM